MDSGKITYATLSMVFVLTNSSRTLDRDQDNVLTPPDDVLNSTNDVSTLPDDELIPPDYVLIPPEDV